MADFEERIAAADGVRRAASVGMRAAESAGDTEVRAKFAALFHDAGVLGDLLRRDRKRSSGGPHLAGVRRVDVDRWRAYCEHCNWRGPVKDRSEYAELDADTHELRTNAPDEYQRLVDSWLVALR